MSEDSFNAHKGELWPIDLPTGDPALVWDLKAQTAWSNQKFSEMFGECCVSIDAAKQWWLRHVHPDDRERIIQEHPLFNPAALSDPAGRWQFRFVFDDGTVVPIVEMRLAVRDGDGCLTRLIHIFLDLMQLDETKNQLIRTDAPFRTLFESSAAGIVLWRNDGSILDANDAFLSLVGHDRADLARGAISWQPAIADEERTISDSVLPYETEYVRKDGSAIPMIVSTSHIHGARFDGLSVVVDVSARQAALAALEQSEERFRILFEASYDVVAILDAEGTIQYQSASVERVLGYRAGDLVGSILFELIHDDDVPAVKAALQRVLSDDSGTVEFQYRCYARDGSLRWMESTAHNLIHSTIAGVVVNSRDVTERRTWALQLERAERLSSLGHLAATVAHEFNNVLMGIQPFAEVLLRTGADNAKVANASTHILRSVDRGKAITKEILRFAQTAEPIIAPVGVQGWFLDMRGELQGILGESIVLEMRLPKEPIAVAADRGQLTQVLTNLVLNARDAMPMGGTVTISASVENDSIRLLMPEHDSTAFVHISIADQGVGIPTDVQQRMFEPLFTTKKGGTGLGLAVTHQVIVAHGGQISIESRLGQGSVFHLFIPRAQVMERDLPERVSTPGERSFSARVLVVEDEVAVAAGICATLEMEGFATHVASSGAQVLSAIDQFHPDIVVLDVGLPDIDGRELYGRIMKIHSKLPVIFSTGHAGGSQLDHIVLNELTGFVQKPYSVDVLVQLIEDLLGRALLPLDGPAESHERGSRKPLSLELAHGVTVPSRMEPRRRRLLTIAAAVIVAAGIAQTVLRTGSSSGPVTGPAPIRVRPAAASEPATPPVTAPEVRHARAQWSGIVNEALRKGRLPFPSDLDWLRGEPDRLRGTATERGTDIISPAGVVIEETRPRFSWFARPGTTYVVIVVDEQYNEMARSESLERSQWTPPRSLPRGRTYRWQVEAKLGEDVEIMPAPPAPPALFRIVGVQHHRDLETARREHPDDLVLLAVLHARAGLRREALAVLERDSSPEAQILLRNSSASSSGPAKPRR